MIHATARTQGRYNALEEIEENCFYIITPEMQRLTPAAKLIKEYSQVLDAKRKTLLMILYRIENSAADELLAKLREFE